jgi:CheY-like chemotaxis protein
MAKAAAGKSRRAGRAGGAGPGEFSRAGAKPCRPAASLPAAKRVAKVVATRSDLKKVSKIAAKTVPKSAAPKATAPKSTAKALRSSSKASLKHRRSRGKARPPKAGPPRAAELALAAFAHDVRTPLTGILALADLLATSGLGERERRWIASIKDAAEHLTGLTTLMLDGTRAGAGRLSARRETFDLARLVAALASSLAARAEAKGLACETAIDAGLPIHAVGDLPLLRTALENLAANAVKFTERGKVAFAVSAAPLARGRLQLVFSISDTGIGMTAAEARRAFRPFAQANRDIIERFGGAGLGLAQVRRLAVAMGGNVEVESAPGRGATFQLTVTVGIAAAPESAPAGEDVTLPAGSPLQLLCVDDNPFGRVVLNALLLELGHQVEFVGSGEDAVERIGGGGGRQGATFDAVLMDITLGGIDGFEAARRIRALPAGNAVPVIGISGRTGSADAAAACGMTAWLEKPVNPRQLAEALAQVARSRPSGVTLGATPDGAGP